MIIARVHVLYGWSTLLLHCRASRASDSVEERVSRDTRVSLAKNAFLILSDRLGGVEHSSSGPNPKYVPVPELDLHAVCLLF